ncbi:hypothetical protein SUDANB99_05834 [Streptomyces sp. enrichment culture]
MVSVPDALVDALAPVRAGFAHRPAHHDLIGKP